MTKKLSILSIVVVLLMSVCFIGCGDSSNGTTTNAKLGNDSVAIEDYSEAIVGKWRLLEQKSADGRDSYKFEDERIWTFNSDGTCNIIKDRQDYYIDCYYKLNSEQPEIAIRRKDVSPDGKFGKNDWHSIKEFSNMHLEIDFYGTINVFERV